MAGCQMEMHAYPIEHFGALRGARVSNDKGGGDNQWHSEFT